MPTKRLDERTDLDSLALIGSLTAVDSSSVGTPLSFLEFSRRFDRQFNRVYSYVSRRLGIEPVCQRVVSEVLVTHLHLLVYEEDEDRIARQLKISTDRLIEEVSALDDSAHDLD